MNTTINPRPNFSSLQNTQQDFPYTILLVGTYTRSWKTIEFMLVAASELATSWAWYPRTLRMRRGPSTNICTSTKIWRAPYSIWAPVEVEFYRNDEQWLQADVYDRSVYLELWREKTRLEARDANKARPCRTWTQKGKHIHITSSPCKIEHMRFYQHSETVPDGWSCR